ncbi:30S ribosomal protein S3ae [Methanocella arvoryzae]|uniref:Small ribosomal subunit protein eS1 n=1 Tax=Methanocella arvoryzae (strain DSM 22066 / NBRC 105507 / MRE50) TaxID=351160 RepID=Q0W2K9_METAR|nr:30S ribosomal protein S3ae [Methanocella arvoryzae]CAJ37384.1 30S ribosomal protein S3AE [Methanocella arvoryzae MRE50]
MARKAGKKVDAFRAKNWYQVIAPAEFNRANIGETLADDPGKMIGRVMESTLGDVTGDWTKQNIKMIFRIEEIGGNSAYTSFLGHELTRDYMRSLVKRRTSKIDANVVVTTKDGFKVRVKPIVLTVKRARTSQIESIRQIMINVVNKRGAELGFTEFINEVVTGKVASEIYKNTKNIYPLRRVEIGKSELVYRPAVAAAKAAPAPEPTPAPAPAPETAAPAEQPKE